MGSFGRLGHDQHHSQHEAEEDELGQDWEGVDLPALKFHWATVRRVGGDGEPACQVADALLCQRTSAVLDVGAGLQKTRWTMRAG